MGCTFISRAMLGALKAMQTGDNSHAAPAPQPRRAKLRPPTESPNLPPLTPIDRDEGFALKGNKAERAAPVF